MVRAETEPKCADKWARVVRESGAKGRLSYKQTLYE